MYCSRKHFVVTSLKYVSKIHRVPDVNGLRWLVLNRKLRMGKLVVLRDDFCGQKTVIKQVQNEIRDCKGGNTKKKKLKEFYCVIIFSVERLIAPPSFTYHDR